MEREGFFKKREREIERELQKEKKGERIIESRNKQGVVTLDRTFLQSHLPGAEFLRFLLVGSAALLNLILVFI